MKKQNVIALLTGLMLTVSVQAQIPKMPEPVTDGRPGIPAQTESWWAEWRKAQAAQEGRGGLVEDEDADGETNFYTGKPYDEDLGSYIFKYRNYSPSQMRWSAQDPSGFPDGANNYCYTNCPLLTVDPFGLKIELVLEMYTTVITYTGSATSEFLAMFSLLGGVAGVATGGIGTAIASLIMGATGYGGSLYDMSNNFTISNDSMMTYQEMPDNYRQVETIYTNFFMYDSTGSTMIDIYIYKWE